MRLDEELDEGRTAEIDQAQLRSLLRLSATGNEDVDIDVSDLSDAVPVEIEDKPTAPAPIRLRETSTASRAIRSA